MVKFKYTVYMKTTSKKPADTSWEGVANWYASYLYDGDDTFQAKVVLPNLTRLLELKPGERLLDLACGPGYFSYAMAQTGAKVTGVDLSTSLIEAAKSRLEGALNPTFNVAPAHKLGFIKNGTIDTISCVLAIQNIENMKDVFAECRRVLSPKGRLLLVLNHPAYRITHESSWGWDMREKIQYRRVDRYLSELQGKIKMHPGSAPLETTTSFHRPMQSYFKALSKNGFAVRRLEEWISHKKSDSGPRAEAENRSRKEIPMFLALEAVVCA